MRGKYAPLHRHLSNLEGREWSTTFREIERILSANLPPSARTYQEWWNPNDRTHSQARAWMVAGWEPANLNLRTETVVFRRSPVSTLRSNTPSMRPSRTVASVALTKTKASSTRAGRPSVIPAKAGIQRVDGGQRISANAHTETIGRSRLPFDIDRLMEGLSRSHPVFHSESDFQDALAEHIRQTNPGSQVRREHTFLYRDSTMRLDIWLPREKIAIELKYPTQMLEMERKDEEYLLADHGAQPLRRYDFLKDVQRLERVVAEKNARGGFAVLLTNQPYYWKRPTRRWRTAIDAAFRLHEGRKVAGELNWSERAGAGTTRGREDLIDIIGSYDLYWRDYSRLGSSSNQRFRYLALSIGSERYPNPTLGSESQRPRRSFFQTLNQWIDEYLKSLGVD